jgi:hypothetical protein
VSPVPFCTDAQIKSWALLTKEVTHTNAAAIRNFFITVILELVIGKNNFLIKKLIIDYKFLINRTDVLFIADIHYLSSFLGVGSDFNCYYSANTNY